MQNKDPSLSKRFSMEAVIVIVVVLSFILTSTVMLGPCILGRPLTEEEAIEISRKSSLVQKAFTFRRGYEVSLEIEHWSTTYIKSIKDEYAWMGDYPYGFLPDDHGVWKLHWEMPSINIVHWVDDLTGQILHESSLNFG